MLDDRTEQVMTLHGYPVRFVDDLEPAAGEPPVRFGLPVKLTATHRRTGEQVIVRGVAPSRSVPPDLIETIRRALNSIYGRVNTIAEDEAVQQAVAALDQIQQAGEPRPGGLTVDDILLRLTAEMKSHGDGSCRCNREEPDCYGAEYALEEAIEWISERHSPKNTGGCDKTGAEELSSAACNYDYDMAVNSMVTAKGGTGAE